MIFLDTVRELSFSALCIFTVTVVLAHIFQPPRFSYLAVLCIVVGGLVALGLAAQFQVEGFLKYLAFGLFVGAFGSLFALLNKYRPIRNAA